MESLTERMNLDKRIEDYMKLNDDIIELVTEKDLTKRTLLGLKMMDSIKYLYDEETDRMATLSKIAQDTQTQLKTVIDMIESKIS